MGAHGTGSVARKRDDNGRWRGRVMVDGRVYTVSSSTSRADCRKRLAARIAEVRAPGFAPPPRRGERSTGAAPATVVPATGSATLADYLRGWLRGKRTTLRSATTLHTYERVVARWIVPFVGAVPFADLSPAHLRDLYARLEERGLARSTVRLVHTILRVALNDAKRDQHPDLNRAVLDTRGPAARKTRHRWPTPDELTRVVEAARSDERYGAAVILTAFSGLRVSELIGLSLDDVDLDAGVVRVTAQLGPDGKRRQPKTEAAARRIVVGPTAVAALGAHLLWRERRRRAMGRSWRDAERLLFVRPDGAPLYPEAVRRALRAALKRAGVAAVRFHALRHGHAMAALRAGVSLEAIRDRLGHTDLATTSIYLHADEVIDADAAARIERLLERRTGTEGGG